MAATAEPSTVLTEWEARQRLAAYGITGPECALATSPAEAVAAAERTGYPVVVKLHSKSIVHKTEAGGVHLDLRSAADVRRAYKEIVKAAEARRRGAADGVLVAPFVRTGIDVFIGAARDASFGPYLLLGLGGIWVEVMDDVAAVALPASEDDVLQALEGLRAAPMLRGAREQLPVDRRALARMALQLGRFMLEQPDVAEVDLNPVRALPEGQGVLVLDARMVLTAAPAATPQRSRPDAETVKAILDPGAVLVVGASSDPTKFGSRLVRFMRQHGFARPIWALHPRGGEVQGVPAFPTLAELPGRADLAFITVGAEQVPGIVRDCGDHGVKAAVIFTSGFAESGSDGQARQDALVARARAANVCLVGPNTAGLISDEAGLYASFIGTMVMEPVHGGNVALITQSGSVGSFFLGRGWERGIGYRAWVATGDEAGVHLEDMVDHFATDPGTRVIAVFIESLRDGRLFRQAVQRARANGKAVVAYGVGRSQAGQTAVRSHTGALAGNQRLYDAVFRQDGVSRAGDLDEMLDAIQMLAWCPRPAGPRVAVVASSGASCGIAADECEANGLLLPAIPPSARRQLASVLPEFAHPNNPLDLTAEVITKPELATHALAAIMGSGAYDILMMGLGTNQGKTAMDVARSVVELQQRTGLPVVVSRMGADSMGLELLAYYREHRIPVFSTPTRAARALRHLVLAGKRTVQGE